MSFDYVSNCASSRPYHAGASEGSRFGRVTCLVLVAMTRGLCGRLVRRWRPERSVFHGVAVCGGNDAMGGRLFDLHNRSPLTRPIAISDLLPFDPLLSARPGAVCGHSFLRMLSRSHSHSGISFQKNTMTAQRRSMTTLRRRRFNTRMMRAATFSVFISIG